MKAQRLLYFAVLFVVCFNFAPHVSLGQEDETVDEEAKLTETDAEENESGTEEDDPDRIPIEDFVLVLSSDNFDRVVEKYPNLMVEFYAPWCGHCKTLAPEYSAAAEALLENDPPVVLAKVDATVETELAQRFEISGYPTIRFFKNGKDYEYDGPRNKEGIVAFMGVRAAPDWEPEPDAVVELNKDNFKEITEREELMLVEFYAPWCGHCKRLAPTYEKAAKQLKREDPPIILAKVDAAHETELASEYGVKGYPTLKVFRKGRAFEYKGERQREYDFISYMISQKGDGAKLISSLKEMKQALQLDDITVVGFFNSVEDTGVQVYKDAADELRDNFKLGICYDEATRKQYKVNPGSVVVFGGERFHTKYEPKWHVLELKDDTSTSDVSKFITDHQVPLVGHYSFSMKKRYDNIRPLCLFFYTVDFGFDHREATQMWRKKIAAVAKKYPDITFAIADDEENSQMLKDFGLEESGEDMNVGLLGPGNKQFGMEPMEEFDAEEIEEFLNKYLKGKLKPHVKSQRPPKKQTGPVTVVVGETFEKIVLDKSKDVLIELYAPWCGHCKKLEPIYASLAKKLKSEKNLVIAKMDATANDAPDNFSASGFPTIYFAPANSKDSPVKYEGNREIEDFEKYLKEKATVSFGKGSKEEL